MPEIPRQVLEYIYELRSPAFLLLDTEGCLLDWGGSPERYGIRRLEKGKPAEEFVAVLEGFFPSGEEQTRLSRVKTGGGLSADVHIVRKEKGYWVIFLDVSLEEEQQKVLQQKLNDMTLLRDRYLKLMTRHLGKEVTRRLTEKGIREPDLSVISETAADSDCGFSPSCGGKKK